LYEKKSNEQDISKFKLNKAFEQKKYNNNLYSNDIINSPQKNPIKSPEKKDPLFPKIKKTNTVNYSLNKKDIISPIKVKKKYIENLFSMSKMGTKSVNQDNYLILENIFEIKDFNILSIFDGHGQNGHFISKLAKDIFIDYFSNHSDLYYIPRIKKGKNNLNIEKSSLNKYINNETVYNRISFMNYKILKTIYKQIDQSIENTEYDKDFSGTTSCSIFIIGKHLICSNVGDSRAILIRDSNKIFPLSIDHKPNRTIENERIKKNGGEIKKIINNQIDNITKKSVQLIPYRVYIKGEPYPGLAMSRSLGDFAAKRVGVINEPEIIDLNIEDNDKFIILASDGLWEVVTNEEARDIVNKYYQENNVKGAVENLISVANDKFQKISDYIDDITIIIIFLNK